MTAATAPARGNRRLRKGDSVIWTDSARDEFAAFVEKINKQGVATLVLYPRRAILGRDCQELGRIEVGEWCEGRAGEPRTFRFSGAA